MQKKADSAILEKPKVRILPRTPPLIKRITHVANFRCYQGWKDHPDAVDFQRLNLVYAPNGTGKSTLATLLSGAPEDLEWSHGMKAVIENGHEGSTREKVDSAGHWIWDSVRLFSADYVRRNLRFDVEDAGTGPLVNFPVRPHHEAWFR